MVKAVCTYCGWIGAIYYAKMPKKQPFYLKNNTFNQSFKFEFIRFNFEFDQQTIILE